MQQNSRPIIILLILLAVALFLIGFRFGKTIERIDKTYVAPQRLAPTPLPSPIAHKPAFSTATYIHPDCGITFLYPAGLQQSYISSTEAKLSESGEFISLSCGKEAVLAFQKEHNATGEAETSKSAGQTIRTYQTKGNITWLVNNQLKGKRVIFLTSKNLGYLIIKTLEFVK